VPLTPALFIFGDSLIDNGNNNYMIKAARANYFPYGIDLGRPTGRFCNGLTVVDYGGNLRFTPSFISSFCVPYMLILFCSGMLNPPPQKKARYLGLPLITAYLSLTSMGRNILRGVNYASAAAGILDETGRHYVS